MTAAKHGNYSGNCHIVHKVNFLHALSRGAQFVALKAFGTKTQSSAPESCLSIIRGDNQTHTALLRDNYDNESWCFMGAIAVIFVII